MSETLTTFQFTLCPDTICREWYNIAARVKYCIMALCGTFRGLQQLHGMSNCKFSKKLYIWKTIGVTRMGDSHSWGILTRSQSSEQSSAFGADLQNFQSWLTANGVKGIGRDNDKVALYTTASGERGLVCTKVLTAVALACAG